METLVNTLGKTLPSTDLTTTAYKLNGELRALSLVYSVELPVVPPPDLLAILNNLQARILEVTEESPNKKRKIEEEEKPPVKEVEKEEKVEESSKIEEVKASCSKDKDVSSTNDDSTSSNADVDWLDRLQSTVTSLIAALQQKSARDEPT
ncbi:hypothetical protein J6590_066173 [Homalodisca vitripennis]|nr:hypothetical protein J6590_066173 [Homalodisca vitripennis]